MKKNIAIKMISTAGLALGFSAGSVFAQQNLIVNGSFESGGAGIKHFPGWDAIGPASASARVSISSSFTRAVTSGSRPPYARGSSAGASTGRTRGTR